MANTSLSCHNKQRRSKHNHWGHTPSAMNFTGCRSRNASGSKSLSSCVFVSSVRRPSIWRNSVVRWVRPLVGSVYALPHVVISLFRDSDFEDLATGHLLSLGPMCGTLFRPKLGNRITIYSTSRLNWKHSCSSSPEPFCGSTSNEGPYKYSLLLLLLLLHSSYSFIPYLCFLPGMYCLNMRRPCQRTIDSSIEISLSGI